MSVKEKGNIDLKEYNKKPLEGFVDKLYFLFSLSNISIADIFRKNILLLRSNKPINICSSEEIRLQSDKHIIIDSGTNVEKEEYIYGERVGERYGYRYSIWLNSPKDRLGRPIKRVEKSKHIPYNMRERTKFLKSRITKFEGYKKCRCRCRCK